MMTYLPVNHARWIIWSGFALLLIAAPLMFHQGASLSLLSQMGTAMIFGLSYNMLLGQCGMLSLGHAVYSGLGAFIAIHAMNLATTGTLVPVILIPLIGGIAGMGFGVLFGYVTTKKSGTTFSMITLGVVELVFAASLMLPEFFGGEGGISTNRVYGQPFWGITFGPQIQVYYLIAFWLLVSTIGMYAFTQTPLGRLANAVRDNPERVEFIGYDPQWVRYFTLIFSAFFAGIAGGLSAINFEIVSAENVSTIRSGAVLLFTFIGGVGFFFGPMIGAVIGTFLTVMLSDFTKAWQLYLGLCFILIVMYAPGGLASLLMMPVQLAMHGKLRRLAPSSAALCAAGMLTVAGAAILIELLYHVTLGAGVSPVMQLFGVSVDTAAPAGWILGVGTLTAGSLLCRRLNVRVMQLWNDVNAEMEEAIRRTST